MKEIKNLTNQSQEQPSASASNRAYRAPASERKVHVHTDHCPHGCAEEYQRTDLEKVVTEGRTWGSEIIAVHCIGEYAFVEYADRDFSSGPNYGKETGAHCFSQFINGHSLSHYAHSLDGALVEAIAYKRDGCNSQAGYLFMKATRPRDGSDCDPETRRHYYVNQESNSRLAAHEGR